MCNDLSVCRMQMSAEFRLGEWSMATDRTGVLIIRAWVEEGSSEPVRAQILMTNDVSCGYEREVTLCDTGAVGAQVEEWLSQFFSDVQGPG